ncbi:MAG: ABC transporter ATP-binding protein, partial [Lachnospiraceae bacterium]|nr:ABC transporter ATP-binding protein [Lachnospiraceae bacterium]
MITTIIGPNGCGKSTLLKTVTGQLKKRGGLVYISGSEIEGLKSMDIARNLSLVMTSGRTDMHMTCREVVEMGRYPYTGIMGRLSEEDLKICDEAIRIADIGDIADMRFSAISDGQRQRVQLARAICQSPEILVLDEPTTFLDIKYKLDIMSGIRELAAQKGMAVLMSLHELDIAMRISDTVFAMGEGRILKSGSPVEVFREDFIRRLYGIDKDRDISFMGEMPWFDDNEIVGNSLDKNGINKNDV